ncbi:HIV Tat-specific factor 1 [Hypanus sabinus]|uniref:HIV Tat-specific factor 1 n=1 Tax=Hypanus sabinus TaxID=79690 RepID=UPI0028C46947|nr:HIV Tat-specific factor 1 [Hypanus sabinus]
MSSDDANAEFYEQLRLQQLHEGGGGQTAGGGTYVDEDGTEFEWDEEKRAWFPKITEDFLATYHASYGFIEETSANSGGDNINSEKTGAAGKNSGVSTSQKDAKGEKRKADAGWIDVEEQKNTSVYVTGLPPDITPDEFVELMSKFGIIMQNPETEEYKIKLYKDKEGNLKGDGLCSYLKKESIDLAVRFLDETEVRGYKLHVEIAKFQMKGEFDASKKKKKSRDYKKKLLLQKKQLDWRPEKKCGESRLRYERVVILKHMFHPKDFEVDPMILNEIRDDLRLECEKFGQVKKVLLFDRHPDGLASVAFKEPEQADECKLALNGRWFGGRQITAETWDGVTDYQIEETVKEREYRLKTWETFLEGAPPAVKSDDQQTEQAPVGPSAPKEDRTTSGDAGAPSVDSTTPGQDSGASLGACSAPLKDSTALSVDCSPSESSKQQGVTTPEEPEENQNEETLSTDSSIDESDSADEEP